ncbi:hypothetical protein MTO96_012682 [Rhipicephalus appendiculatus]
MARGRSRRRIPITCDDRQKIVEGQARRKKRRQGKWSSEKGKRIAKGNSERRAHQHPERTVEEVLSNPFRLHRYERGHTSSGSGPLQESDAAPGFRRQARRHVYCSPPARFSNRSYKADVGNAGTRRHTHARARTHSRLLASRAY